MYYLQLLISAEHDSKCPMTYPMVSMCIMSPTHLTGPAYQCSMMCAVRGCVGEESWLACVAVHGASQWSAVCGCDHKYYSMQVYPRDSCRWTRRCCCCGPRTPSLLIFMVYIVLHTCMVSISCLMLHSPGDLLRYILIHLDTRDHLLEHSDIYKDIKEAVLTVSRCFLL